MGGLGGCLLGPVVEIWEIGVMGRWPWVFLGIECLRNSTGRFKVKWTSRSSGGFE